MDNINSRTTKNLIQVLRSVNTSNNSVNGLLDCLHLKSLFETTALESISFEIDTEYDDNGGSYCRVRVFDYEMMLNEYDLDKAYKQVVHFEIKLFSYSNQIITKRDDVETLDGLKEAILEYEYTDALEEMLSEDMIERCGIYNGSGVLTLNKINTGIEMYLSSMREDHKALTTIFASDVLQPTSPNVTTPATMGV